MQLKEIRELVKILEKSNLNEMNIVNGDFEIHLQKSANVETVAMPQYAAPAPVAAPVAQPVDASAPVTADAPAVSKSNLIEFKSPMVCFPFSSDMIDGIKTLLLSLKKVRLSPSFFAISECVVPKSMPTENSLLNSTDLSGSDICIRAILFT